MNNISFSDKIKLVLYRKLGPLVINRLWKNRSFQPYTIRSMNIPGQTGTIPLRIYTPRPLAAHETLPVLVYYHGGGFAICDLDTHHATCCDLAGIANCIVVSVDYRLAPEHRFPTGLEDCIAATHWVYQHAEELLANRACFFVAGDSAGGNFAAVIAQHFMPGDVASDDGDFEERVKISGQILIYPVTDFFSPPRPSYIRYAKGKRLTKGLMNWFHRLYLEKESDVADPRVSPLLAKKFAGLPAALVITAEYDPLRDEGEEYAEVLQNAGVPTELKRYPKMCHGFIGTEGPIPQHLQAINDIAAWLESRCRASEKQ